jgi:mono/diheme cytochrome c family protein
LALPPSEEGKLIFTSRCDGCHNINKVPMGPALAGVSDRHTQDWIIQFIHSSQTVIKGGDKAAIELLDHTDLRAENIKSILTYIKSVTKKSLDPVGFRPERLHPNYSPIAITY